MDGFFLVTAGPQISCFPPSNFTVKQAAYVDTYCWDTLMHHEPDSSGNFEERSLWVHKVGGGDPEGVFMVKRSV